MEAYALEIQMYAETRNNKRLKVLQMLKCYSWVADMN